VEVAYAWPEGANIPTIHLAKHNKIISNVLFRTSDVLSVITSRKVHRRGHHQYRNKKKMIYVIIKWYLSMFMLKARIFKLPNLVQE
jgi:hypothetical protein